MFSWLLRKLVECSPDSESGLHEGDDAGNEEDRRDDVTPGGVVAFHAESRTNDKRNRHGTSKHCQVMLKTIEQFFIN